jgi:hypothetical protein
MHPNTSAAALAGSSANSPSTSTPYNPSTFLSGDNHHHYYQNDYHPYGSHGSSSNYQSGYHPLPVYPSGSSSARNPYNQSDDFPAQPAGSSQYTRNLIGSLTGSAFRLRNDSGELGIWFVMQDLSVRTEGTFRLQFSFLNLGLYTPKLLRI